MQVATRATGSMQVILRATWPGPLRVARERVCTLRGSRWGRGRLGRGTRDGAEHEAISKLASVQSTLWKETSNDSDIAAREFKSLTPGEPLSIHAPRPMLYVRRAAYASRTIFPLMDTDPASLAPREAARLSSFLDAARDTPRGSSSGSRAKRGLVSAISRRGSRPRGLESLL